MAITIKDIAKILNVSPATVSKALSDMDDISYETKIKVRNLAEELNYKPNYLARGLVKKESKTIGLIIPDITNPFYPEIARAIEETVNKEGFSVFLCNSNWDNKKELEYMSILISKRVDGVIIAPIGTKHLKSEKYDFPIVSVGTKESQWGENYVVINDEKGGYLATSHLIKNGCKNIIFAGGREDVFSNKERLNGYKKALIENNIKIKDANIYNMNFKRESGYLITQKAINSGLPIDGVFAGNDIIALGVIQAIRESGLSIPKDIKVVGFDDIIYTLFPEVSLTTIVQPKNELGIMAAQMLLEKIKNPSFKSTNVILEPKIVIRNTSI